MLRPGQLDQLTSGGHDPVIADEPLRPRDPVYLRDPYPTLAALRGKGPCVVDPGTGRWFLLSSEAVESGLAQIVRGHPKGPDRHVHFPGNPFAADGPGHTGPRRVIAPAMTNRSVQRHRRRVQQIVDDVLADKVDGSELRVVEEIGFTLPYEITCDLLGIPTVDDPAELRDWTWRSLELIDAFLTPEELQADLDAAASLAAHIAEVAAWKRDHPGDDLFSAVITAADAGEVMRPEQIVPYIHTLYLAGMHTTVNQTVLSMHAFMTNRSQWELLVSDPDLLDNAVEEVLRFEPTAHYFRRTAEVDVEIAGIVVPQGTEVLCWIASANRDPAKWGPTADEFDITRADARHHIAFGKGAHACLGSWLARLELNVVIGALVERFPGTVMEEQDLVWTSDVIRGPEELVLTLRV